MWRLVAIYRICIWLVKGASGDYITMEELLERISDARKTQTSDKWFKMSKGTLNHYV